jgi:hypothetical protein
MHQIGRLLRRATQHPGVAAFIVAIAAAGLVIIIGSITFGSIDGFLAFVSGHAIHAETELIDIGGVAPDHVTKVSFRVRNLRRRPVTINGIRVSCGCVQSAAVLPITLAPGSVRQLPFTVRVSPRDRRMSFTETAELYIDTASPPCLLHIQGRILKPMDKDVGFVAPNSPAISHHDRS